MRIWIDLRTGTWGEVHDLRIIQDMTSDELDGMSALSPVEIKEAARIFGGKV